MEKKYIVIITSTPLTCTLTKDKKTGLFKTTTKIEKAFEFYIDSPVLEFIKREFNKQKIDYIIVPQTKRD